MNDAAERSRDKVCVTCGSIGFVESIVTCRLCEKASQHIYCMPTVGCVAPDRWHCEDCLVGVPDGELSNTDKNQEIFDTTSFTFEKTEVYDQGNLLLNDLDNTEMNQTGSPKLITSQRGSKNIFHTSKTEKLSVRVAPPVKNLPRTSSLETKETAKVKFISAEEVTRLASGAKARESTIWSSTSVNRIHQTITLPPVGLHGRVANKSISTLHMKKSADAEAHASPFKRIITLGKKDNRMPGEEASVFFHEEEHTKRSPSGDVFSPRYNRNRDLKGYTSAPSSKRTDGHRKRREDTGLDPKHMDSTLLTNCEKKVKIGSDKGKEALANLSDDCYMNAKLVKSSIPDNKLSTLRTETAVGSLSTGKSVKKSPSGSSFDSEIQHKETVLGDAGLQMCLQVHPVEKLSNYPTAEVCWKGTFEIFDVKTDVYIGVQAHCPQNISLKVYNMIQQMPKNFKLKVVPRADAWPRAFQSDPPDSNDIGLYFLPCELQRPKEEYFGFLERIDSDNSALKGSMDDVELLVFTSKQLPLDSQCIGKEIYLWGVFRHLKRKNFIQQKQEEIASIVPAAITGVQSSSQVNEPLENNFEEVDMEIDMVGGVEIGLPDVFIRDTPVLGNERCGEKTLVKFEMKKQVRSPIKSTTLPVFSKSVSHGENSSDIVCEPSAISRKEPSGSTSVSPRVGHRKTKEACEVLNRRQVFSRANRPSVETKKSCDISKKYNLPKGEPPNVDAKLNYMRTNLPSLSKEKARSPMGKPMHKNAILCAEDTSLTTPTSGKKKSSFGLFESPTSENVRGSPVSVNAVCPTGRDYMPPPIFSKCQISPETPLHESIAKDGDHESPFQVKGVQDSALTNAAFSVTKEVHDSKEEIEARSSTDRVQDESRTIPSKWVLVETKGNRNMTSTTKWDQMNSRPCSESAGCSSLSDNPASDNLLPIGEPKGELRIQNELHEMNKQWPMTVSYQSTSQSPERPLLSGNQVLTLFPLEGELTRHNVDKLSHSAPEISPDLCLSRPQYVQDGNAWISNTLQEQLKKDHCGEELQLSL